MSRIIVNTWDQMVAAGGDQIGFFWSGTPANRSCDTSKWSVLRLVDGKERLTDKSAHFLDHGRKAFHAFPIRERKAPALQEALVWAKNNFPQHALKVYVRNRMGDMVEKSVNERFPINREKLAKVAK